MFIIIITFAGGWIPLFNQEKARITGGFPSGEAFTAGVFLALSLTIMMPSALHLQDKAFPIIDYPLVSLIVIIAFVFLLSLEHISLHLDRTNRKIVREGDELSPASIPIIMTLMIAIPSFFLGAALGVSDTAASIFIFVAIVAHKSSAGFALALKMVRSTLTKNQTFLIFTLFAFSTPLGILVGADIHQYLGSRSMIIIKGFVLALASGTFLYMSTLHELKSAPMIANCNTRKGFLLLLSGFVITAIVRLLIGEAHRF